MPISPRLFLFDRPSKGLLPRVSRQPILHNNNETNHTALISRQSQASKESDTYINISFLPTRFTVAVQWEDRVAQMHGTIIGQGSKDHSGRCNKIRETKIRHIITRIKWYVKTTPISTEDYLRNEMVIANKHQTDDKLNENTDLFTKNIIVNT